MTIDKHLEIMARVVGKALKTHLDTVPEGEELLDFCLHNFAEKKNTLGLIARVALDADTVDTVDALE